MYFKIYKSENDVKNDRREPKSDDQKLGVRIGLVHDTWNDYGFRTAFTVFYVTKRGQPEKIGRVKIGQFGLSKEQPTPDIPSEFNSLGSDFFSLGQDVEYYSKIAAHGNDIRDEFFSSLKDMAYNQEIFKEARDEGVTGISLLRHVTVSSVTEQYRRIADGGEKLSDFFFEYTLPPMDNKFEQGSKIVFDVRANSSPPTNVHVVIGGNGAGKTHLLNNMALAVVNGGSDVNKNGEFTGSHTNQSVYSIFANIVSVSFSAFDKFKPTSVSRNKSHGPQYTYVGLKYLGKNLAPKTPSDLQRDFTESAKICVQGARKKRWLDALRILETDRVFQSANVSELLEAEYFDENDFKKKSAKIFGSLGAGHKIVLLTITRLVETVNERTLVLLDEPEAHLHPPLIAAFTRAISNLLFHRNGVAIIATHSPIILQEVPKTCVWVISKFGDVVKFERPQIETFGENIGILTHEVFGLEVSNSGFHTLIKRAEEKSESYSELINEFRGQIGGEGRGIARILTHISGKE